MLYLLSLLLKISKSVLLLLCMDLWLEKQTCNSESSGKKLNIEVELVKHQLTYTVRAE